MRKLLIPLLAGAAVLASTGTSHAQVSTFAQSFQSPSTGNPFSYTAGAEVGPVSPGTTMTYGGGPVTFRYLASPLTACLPGAVVNVDILSNLTFSVTGVQQIVGITGATLTEQINTMGFTFTAAAGNGVVTPGSVLLSANAGVAVPTGGAFSGSNGGNGATLSGSDPFNNVNFFSPYISTTCPGFLGFAQESYSYSFTSVNPIYAAHAGGTSPGFPPFTGFLNSFTAAGTGTFSSAAAVPEPGILGLLLGSGVSGSLLFLRRRRA